MEGWCIIYMRKYIDDLGIEFEDTPQGWCLDEKEELDGWTSKEKRESIWRQEREKYGFDSRETWDLAYSFKLWLYERLSMYNEIVQNCIDTRFSEFDYKCRRITLQDGIDRILEGLKLDLTLDEYDLKRENKDIKKKIDDVMPLFSLCLNALWW